ncbi:tetratricopeptide repeat protein [Flavobacterium sp.]|uniref:tetratricopeptide repeat-containing sensor histidine kinase n=1 Tax=Flavobacterium sp. TaxID=239 RepID=UPI0039E36A65
MRKWVTLLLLFSLSLSAQQKNTIDSLLHVLPKLREDSTKVEAFNRLSLAYFKRDSVKGFSYARKALALSEKIQWQDGIAQSNFTIGKNYDANFKYDKALDFLNKAAQQTRNKRLLSKIHTSIGGVHFNQAEYSHALAAYHRALKIDESLNDKMGVAEISMNIASIYYSIKNYQKAVLYINKSLRQKVDDQAFLAMLNRNIAVIYNNMGQPLKALDYFEKSLSFYQSVRDNSATASVLSDIALTYYDLEDYEKAIDYSKRSLQVPVIGVPDKVNISFSYGIIGDSYTQKARGQKNNRPLLDSAVDYLNKAIKLHQELDNIRGLYDDYTSLTEAQQLQGDFKKALETYQTSITFKDSIFNTENKETIRAIEDKRAIELRDKELKINDLQLEANQRQKWALSLGIVFLGVIGGLLYYQSASRKETNRHLHSMNADLDRANHIKTRLLSILNHDLRSPVNSFIHYIQFRKESPELLDEAAKIRIENATLESAKNLLHSMEDMLLWSKDQMKNFEPQPQKFRIRTVFESIEKHFSAVTDTPIRFESDTDLEIDTDENYLKTIIRNLTANALNATRERAEPQIVWRAWQTNGQTFLSLSDNGPGMSQEKVKVLFDQDEISGVKSGLGLHLVRDLAKAIHCKISVESGGSGTIFTLSMA